jgi:hypothetical protein
MRQKHSSVRSQYVYHVKNEIGKLYDLPSDPTAISRRVDYLLEKDRFMCLPKGYEVSLSPRGALDSQLNQLLNAT